MSDINTMKTVFSTKAKKLASNQGKKIGDKTVDNAWNLAQSEVQDQGQNMSNPQVLPTVDYFASNNLGLYDDPSDQERKQTMLSNPQDLTQMKKQQGTMMEKYIPFEVALRQLEEKSEDSTDEDRDPAYQGQTKEEAADEIIKTLKKKDYSKNAIVHALISRLQLDLDCAISIVYGDKGIPKDEEKLPTDPLDLCPEIYNKDK